MSNKEYTYVFLRPTIPPEEQIFHCYVCRHGIIKVTGRVFGIVPGNEPFNDGVMKTPFVIKCSGFSPEMGRCKAHYAFEGFVE